MIRIEKVIRIMISLKIKPRWCLKIYLVVWQMLKKWAKIIHWEMFVDISFFVKSARSRPADFLVKTRTEFRNRAKCKSRPRWKSYIWKNNGYLKLCKKTGSPLKPTTYLQSGRLNFENSWNWSIACQNPMSKSREIVVSKKYFLIQEYINVSLRYSN